MTKEVKNIKWSNIDEEIIFFYSNSIILSEEKIKEEIEQKQKEENAPWYPKVAEYLG